MVKDPRISQHFVPLRLVYFKSKFLSYLPVAIWSLGPQVLQSARYTSELPVAMSLDGLRMYCSDYGDSSDDSRPDKVPNSSSGHEAPDNSDQDSGVDCNAKKKKC